MSIKAESLQARSPEFSVIEEIKHTEPLLFELAEQVLSADTDWNVLLGDDMGGRLPAHFLHRVLKESGNNIPTFFVAGSQTYRDARGEAPYDDYFKAMRDSIGQPLRPLIVTESINTGATLDFIASTMRPYCEEDPEIAVVAAFNEASATRANYVGGVGKEAAEQVQKAYEHLNPASLKRRAIRFVMEHSGSIDLKHSPLIPQAMRQRWQGAPNATIGIEPSLDSERPIAVRSKNHSGALTAEAFQTMDVMADKFIVSRTAMEVAA